ncbi:MAG: hypothetical protein ISS79_00310 [Phycisphaerae bacterium]|nr:hypothetical protein [Phycisphaerae bacterium]
MWKPYNCPVAQREEIVNLTKKAFLCLSKCDVKDLLHYITSAIAIVAFLLAVDYFSAKPSLRIGIGPHPRGYHMDSLLEYYQANNITFPKQLMEDQSLHKLFARDTKSVDPNHVHILGGTPDEAIIGAIVKGQEIGSFVEYRIDKLERQIGKYTYIRHVYGYMDDRGFYDEQKFTPTLEYIETKISRIDYYIFLAALIRSREVDHTVFITNDGDIDLKNVRVTFPAPLSKVTASRTKNILNCRANTSLLHEILESTSDLTLRLPSFKKGESLCLHIRTRENQINSNEVFESYQRDKLIDKARALLYFFLILIIIFALSLNRAKHRSPGARKAGGKLRNYKTQMLGGGML